MRKVSSGISMESIMGCLDRKGVEFEEVFTNAPCAVVLVSFDGRLLRASKAFCEMLSYTENELINLAYQSIVSDNGSNYTYKYLLNRFTKGKIRTHRIEEEFCTKNGKVINAVLSVSLVRDKNQNPNHFIYQVIETGESSQNIDIKKELLGHNKIFEAAFSQSEIGMVLVSLKGRLLKFNKKVEETSGYTSQELENMDISMIFHEDDRESALSKLALIQNGELSSYTSERRLYNKRGAILHALVSVAVISDQEMRPLYIFSQIQDITESKKTQQALRESEERYDLAIQSSKAFLWDWNIQSGNVYLSPGISKIIGVKNFKPLSMKKDFDSYIHKDDLETKNRLLDLHLSRKRRTYEAEYRVRHKKGYYVWVQVSGKAIWNEDGIPIRMVGSIIDITAKKNAELSLAKKNKMFRSIFTHSSIGLAIVSLEGEILQVNNQLMKYSGYRKRELVGKIYTDFFHDSEDKEGSLRKLCTILRDKGTTHSIYKKFKDKRGKIVWGVIKGVIIRGEFGRALYWIMQIVDITKAKITQELLKESEKRYALALEGANVGIWDYNLVEDVIYCSPRFKSILGLDNKFSFRSVREIENFIHPGDRDISYKAFKKIKYNNKHFALEFRMRHSDGHYIWMRVKGKATKNEKKEIVRITGYIEDISDWKISQKKLFEKNNTFKSIFDHSRIGMVMISPRYKYLRVNKSFCNMTGYTQKELLNMGFVDITHPGDLPNDFAAIRSIFSGKSNNYKYEKRYVRKDGKTIWCMILGVLICDINNRPLYIATQVQDITEKREAELALRESETRYALAVKGSKAAIWDWNILTDSVYTSERMREIMGRNISYPIPYRETYTKMIHPDDKKIRADAMSRHLNKEQDTYDIEYRIKHQKGHYIWVHASGKAIWDKKGKPIRLAGSVIDISERKEVEIKVKSYMKELEQTNQDLNDFAFIASHDLKEPIRGISNNATMFKEDYEEIIEGDGLRRIDRILFLCSKMEKLVRDLLHFAKLKHQEVIIQKVDLNVIIEDIKGTIESLLESSNARIVVPKVLPKVSCDKILISILLQNLITNGIKYNQSKAKKIEIGYKKEIINKYLKIPQYVFYVKDNGIGISPEFHQDVFRIFKRIDSDDTGGTGVGLTFVEKIIKRHDGKIWLESEEGNGTTFFFTLSQV